MHPGPKTITSFLEQGISLSAERLAVIDEPDQPAPPLHHVTYTELLARAQAMQIGLDNLDVGVGDRVAVISQNCSRSLQTIFGVPGNGRELVVLSHELSRNDVYDALLATDVRVLVLDPELRDKYWGMPPRYVLTTGREFDTVLFGEQRDDHTWLAHPEDHSLLSFGDDPRSVGQTKEHTHADVWSWATTLGEIAAIHSRDVGLHVLPMLDPQGLALTCALIGHGARNVVLRRGDGIEVLRYVDEHRVTVMRADESLLQGVLEAIPEWDAGPVPGRDSVRVLVKENTISAETRSRVDSDLGWICVDIRSHE